jgi:CBS domain-containing protein
VNTSPSTQGQHTAAPVVAAPARSIMSRPVVAVEAETTLAGALAALAGSGVRHLAVVEATGRCVGVLADRVIAAAWAHEPFGLDRRPVRDFLDAPAAVVPLAATVADVARFMHEHRVDAVVVVGADGVPVGIVTATDVVTLVANQAAAR